MYKSPKLIKSSTFELNICRSRAQKISVLPSEKWFSIVLANRNFGVEYMAEVIQTVTITIWKREKLWRKTFKILWKWMWMCGKSFFHKFSSNIFCDLCTDNNCELMVQSSLFVFASVSQVSKKIVGARKSNVIYVGVSKKSNNLKLEGKAFISQGPRVNTQEIISEENRHVNSLSSIV